MIRGVDKESVLFLNRIYLPATYVLPDHALPRFLVLSALKKRRKRRFIFLPVSSQAYHQVYQLTVYRHHHP